MSFIFEPTARKLPLASKLCDAQLDETTRCTHKSSAVAFPTEATKVAVTNVDTTGREVLLSGQEGICVQWR
jgi:hypothetical protein